MQIKQINAVQILIRLQVNISLPLILTEMSGLHSIAKLNLDLVLN